MGAANDARLNRDIHLRGGGWRCIDTPGARVNSTNDGSGSRTGFQSRRVARTARSPSAPALTVRVGESLVVQPTTRGSACIDPDATVAVASGQLATVVTYQQHATPPNGAWCSRQLKFEPRTISVDFTWAESATLRFIARTSDVSGRLVAVERRVLVR